MVLSKYFYGEEGTVERHESRLTVNLDEQRFSWYVKEQVTMYGFGTYDTYKL